MGILIGYTYIAHVYNYTDFWRVAVTVFHQSTWTNTSCMLLNASKGNSIAHIERSISGLNIGSFNADWSESEYIFF